MFKSTRNIRNRISSRFNRANSRFNKKAGEIEDVELTEVLPQGSGIDYDWDFEVIDNSTVRASNGWHYMSPDGYYLGGIGFEMELKRDGSFEGPFFDIPQLAKDQLGKDIVEVLMGDPEMNDEPVDVSTLSESEIEDILKDEMGYIADYIWQTFDAVDKDKLAKAVDNLIGDLGSTASRRSFRRPVSRFVRRSTPMARRTAPAAGRRLAGRRFTRR